MRSNNKTRVLIADDHRLVIDGLRSLLSREKSIEVVGEVMDGKTLLETVDVLRPDVVLLDVSMPDMDGITALKQLLTKDGNLKVLILTMHQNFL